MKLFHFASKCPIKNFTLFYQSVLLYDKNVVTLQPILETIGLIIKENEVNSNYSRTSYGVRCAS